MGEEVNGAEESGYRTFKAFTGGTKQGVLWIRRSSKEPRGGYGVQNLWIYTVVIHK